MSNNQPIGVFDSGLGGLTVLKEITSLLPHENLVYLGDDARVPYGNKSPETVLRYSIENILFLLSQKVKAIVIACNTSTAYALEKAQDYFKIPIIGVVTPGARAALKNSKTKRIGVIGTSGTIQSKAYEKKLKELNKNIFVVSRACPLLVSFAEAGVLGGAALKDVLKEYLNPLKKEKVNALILGCTHYPLIEKSIAEIMGNSVRLINSGFETALDLQAVLKKSGLENKTSQKGEIRFFSTDSPDKMKEVGRHFFGKTLAHVQKVEL